MFRKPDGQNTDKPFCFKKSIALTNYTRRHKRTSAENVLPSDKSELFSQIHPSDKNKSEKYSLVLRRKSEMNFRSSLSS
jgi:hypothetical protein